MIAKEIIQDVVKAYIITAIWLEDLAVSVYGIEAYDYERVEADVNKIIIEMKKTLSDDDVIKLLTTEGKDGNLFGHDLYLTRNGHGAGFWDKPEYYGEENATLLTELSKKLGTDDEFYHYERN